MDSAQISVGPHTLWAYIANTPELRRAGLQHRHLAPHTGMLFVFGDTKNRSFWMKDVPAPLDMIFIDEHGVVVGVIDSAPAGSTRYYSVGVPSQYVLEVPGGWAAAHGVGVGTTVRF